MPAKQQGTFGSASLEDEDEEDEEYEVEELPDSSEDDEEDDDGEEDEDEGDKERPAERKFSCFLAQFTVYTFLDCPSPRRGGRCWSRTFGVDLGRRERPPAALPRRKPHARDDVVRYASCQLAQGSPSGRRV